MVNMKSTIDDIKAADARRPDFPGEHVAVLTVGLLLLLGAGRGRSFLVRSIVGAAGTALIGRAASGTGGVAKLASVLGNRRTSR